MSKRYFFTATAVFIFSLTSSQSLICASAAESVLPAKDYVAKTLTAPSMKLLSDVLRSAPIAIVRMHLANLAARKALHSFNVEPTGVHKKSPADEQAEVHVHLKRILSPVKDFLLEIKEYTGIVKPLIVESLGEKEAAQSLLMKSFDEALISPATTAAGENPVEQYFLRKVTNRDELHKVCLDFNKFFSDLHKSFSPDALAAFQELWREIVTKNAAK